MSLKMYTCPQQKGVVSVTLETIGKLLFKEGRGQVQHESSFWTAPSDLTVNLLKVEEHKVSNIHQLYDVVTEESEKTPVATCEALVNSMSWKILVGTQNIDILT
ncbi:hypothetical protein ILYODFUR_011264 [Ilyodon furcidens]|uniref:Uncharacterized protein n=1 Tax=Ilyodon furcidens TaxID=33524 RepID=A0ABV0VEM9_9TELE